MKFLVVSTLNWLFITIVFFIGFKFDGINFSLAEIYLLWPLLVITGLFSAIYYVFFAGIGYSVLKAKNLLEPKHFFIASLICSLPMLLAMISTSEIEWVISTVVAGLLIGIINSFMLGRRNGT